MDNQIHRVIPILVFLTLMATATPAASALADLGFTQTANPTTTVVGEAVAWKATITNYGPDPATGIVVQCDHAQMGGGTQTSNIQMTAGRYSASTHNWTISSLASGQSADLTWDTVYTRVGQSTHGMNIIASIPGDPNPANDGVYTTVTVIAETTPTPRPAPVAAFTATPQSGQVPLTVQFTDQSANSPTGWSWTFGDGGTSSVQNPNHFYTAAGSYTVILQATNAAGSDMETKTGYITVSAPATAGDLVGVYNNAGTWALHQETGSNTIVGFGWANTVPVVGEWDTDGVTDVGIYNRGGNNFLIPTASGVEIVGLGWSGVIPVVGDWDGNGRDTVGVFDPATGTWALHREDGTNDVFGFGWANTVPVVGDWDNDGVTDVGIYNRGGNNFLIPTASGVEIVGLGWSGVTPVVGDWNGDGRDQVGVYNNAGTWALHQETGSNTIVGFGWSGTEPIIGDWDGDGVSEVGIYNRGGNNFLIPTDGGVEVVGLGWSGVTPVVGDWG